MEKEKNRGWVKYLATAAIGLAVALGLMASGGLFAGVLSTAGAMMVLSDAFFVPGTVLTGVGLLVFIAGEGGFDIFAYSVKLLKDVCFHNKWERESFHDYKRRKADQGKARIDFILVVGVVFLVIAAVFTGLFYYYYG